ncbi:MAG: hypothetical protein GY839_00975 [candidate division Zixibacteria bacterium]|nr:hypothetical protein [candidate division Zixibacteria bacterium]
MPRILINPVTAIALIVILASTSLADPKYNRQVRDSVTIGRYTAITYESVSFEGEKLHEELMIKLGPSPAMSTMSKSIQLYNFGSDADDPSGASYTKDLNGNGTDDIIVVGHTGLGSCCNHISIHSLDEKFLTEIGRFKLLDVDVFYLEDLDKDSLPEIIFRDANFGKWNAPFDESPMPLLIWKWYEGKYRLANIKFSDYLKGKRDKDNPKKLKKLTETRMEKEYDPKHEFYRFPPSLLWGMMLDYIYAGDAEAADSLFNAEWPKEIPGKQEFYDSFQAQLKKGIYWPEIGRSDF